MIELLSTKTIMESPWLTLHCDQIRFPSGKEATYYVVDRPSCALVVPMIGNDVLLIKQFRHPVNKWCIEVVAGLIENGEDPQKAAERELLEETGAVASQMTKLAVLDVSPAMMRQKAHVFLATIDHMEESALEQTEVIEQMRVPFAEAVRMARSGEISGVMAVSALLLADAALHQS